MDRESIIQKFQDLNLWKSGEKRAPHKPLLVIYAIGKLLQSGSRLIPYSEIDEKLGNLLKEFGPRQTNTGTQYPFWRLQNDGIWKVSDADKIGLTDSGDALKGDLVRYNVSGGFSEAITQRLQQDSKLASEIIHGLLYAHFPASIHEDILQAAGIEDILQIPKIVFAPQISKTQTRSPLFPANVLKAYEYKCTICGFDVKLGHKSIGLEAAHIKWHAYGGPDETMNGLALCVLHHKLFDRGAFTLSEQLEILVSDNAHGSVGFKEWLMRFHGEKINFPQRQSFYPNASFIGWHVREVFKGNYRAK